MFIYLFFTAGDKYSTSVREMSDTAVNFQRQLLYKHGPKLWLLSLCLDPNSPWNCSDVSECAVNIFHAQITFLNMPVRTGEVPLVTAVPTVSNKYIHKGPQYTQ